MATSGELLYEISHGKRDSVFRQLYGGTPQRIARQRERYCDALLGFEAYYGPGRQVRVFSAPGRIELGGNHTDHQNGVALAAAADLDIIAVTAPCSGGLIRVKSYGFDKLDVIDLARRGPQAGESTHSASLIRGIAEEMLRRGGKAGGFDAYTTSDVLRGSGLSSSAAFEIVIGTILNSLYNAGRFSPLTVAQIAQYAENTFFGKPSGLMDPLSCAVGGAICVDLKNPEHPVIRKIGMDMQKTGYCLCITDTKGSHSEMTEEFTRIRTEMEAVSHFFGKPVLRQITEQQVIKEIVPLRKACGDRAILRALHYFAECRRAKAEASCLAAEDFAGFLRQIAESGHSSFEYNQNAYCIDAPEKQAIPLALALSQKVLHGRGAWRLQGGGFAGTIQAFVPPELLGPYRQAMDSVFGAGSCRVVRVRSCGAKELF
jgi:galactokinase